MFVGMPAAAWLLAVYLIRRLDTAQQTYDMSKRVFVAVLPKRHRVLVIILFLAAFLFMELMWRVMFQYLVAFMQMRDALVVR